MPKDINALLNCIHIMRHKSSTHRQLMVCFVQSYLQVIAILSLNFPNLYSH